MPQRLGEEPRHPSTTIAGGSTGGAQSLHFWLGWEREETSGLGLNILKKAQGKPMIGDMKNSLCLACLAQVISHIGIREINDWDRRMLIWQYMLVSDS